MLAIHSKLKIEKKMSIVLSYQIGLWSHSESLSGARWAIDYLKLKLPI